MAKRKVLLIGWDAADWKIINKLMAEGGMDGVRSLMTDGVYSNLSTLEPQLSPMLWTSVVTGKMAYHHGVHGFTEVDALTKQISPVSAATRQCKTLWEMLGEHGLRSHLVSWFATQGEKNINGKMVSNTFSHLYDIDPDSTPKDWPDPVAGTYWPEDLANEMNQLRVSPHEIDGEILNAFLPSGDKIDQNRDHRIGRLREHLAKAYSAHSAATHLMESDPDWAFMAVYFQALDDVAHDFMHFHPPKMEGIPDDDFEIYQHVVNSAYRVLDMMLQRLLQLAGEGVTVFLVSDHGFHSDHLRPAYTPRVPAGIAVWHRKQGVLMASGPGIQKTNQSIYGASLLDITPTILHAFDLPMGEDMEGRVLDELFTEKKSVQSVPTWEDHEHTKHTEKASLTGEESQALLEHYVALGYLSDVEHDSDEAVEETIRENKWSLARAYIFAGKDEQALALLEDCFTAYPERTDYAQLLARTQFQLGLIKEAEETLAVCLDSFGNTIAAELLQGQIKLQQGNYKSALVQLEKIRDQSPDHPQLLELLCTCCVAVSQWDDAEEIGEKLSNMDPDNYLAQLTLAEVAIHRNNNFELAVEHGLQAIEIHYGDPRAHSVLGYALFSLGRMSDAEIPLLNALRLQPSNEDATATLVKIYQQMGEIEKASACQNNLLRIKSEQGLMQVKRLDSIRFGIASRAKKRHAEREAERERASELRSSQSALKGAEGEEEYLIVSGLPRSGTSLMMQMLNSVGLSPMHDNLRLPDVDNPEGYWEWEQIKSLQNQPKLIEQAAGKSLKVVSALLPSLPPHYRYRIIFMRRPVEEIVASQWAMLERNGKQPRAERQHLIDTQINHVEQTIEQLKKRSNVNLLEIDYPRLVMQPSTQINDLKMFLSEYSSSANLANLLDPIQQNLYRQRST